MRHSILAKLKCIFMKRIFFLPLILLSVMAFPQQTVFEKSNGKATATYFEVIRFYKELSLYSSIIKLETSGQTNAGYPGVASRK